jgi:hypothetical protein
LLSNLSVSAQTTHPAPLKKAVFCSVCFLPVWYGETLGISRIGSQVCVKGKESTDSYVRDPNQSTEPLVFIQEVEINEDSMEEIIR